MKNQRLQGGASPAERSLLEQLQISDREIQSRKELLDFASEDEALLGALQPIVADSLDKIVATFYERQLQSREISLVIGDADTLERLRNSMRRYILELFEGYYDAEYVNKRLRIGKVHQRIGVSPKLYVSAQSLLQTTLYDLVLPLTCKTAELAERERQRAAVRKLLMFDMQLVFDTYISTLIAEVDTARTELEEYAGGLEETIAERTEQLREMSTRDSLTKLYNQRGFHENLRREIAVAERNHEPLSLIYCDLNGFKILNDTKGHAEGDRLLNMVGAAIICAIREVDFGCRYGGDEFCIILPRTDLEQARTVHARMVKAFEKGPTHEVTFSTGIVQTGPEGFLHPDTLVKQADALMYKAKAKSKKKPGHYVELQSVRKRKSTAAKVDSGHVSA